MIPYFGQISQKIKNILNSHNITTSFRNNCSFKQFIKLGKDALNNCDQSNLVYKINCEICGKSYVGQKKRLLKTRCNEHKNNIKLNSKYHNVITKYIVENRDHTFNWKKTQIIHKENNFSKRLIAEMIFIKKEKDNRLNKIIDCDNLSESYFPLISDISNYRCSY